jgi:hypothetical protein
MSTGSIHDPAGVNQEAAPAPQMNPPPESAAGQPVDLWVKIGYRFQADRVRVYYTTDGTSYPEGGNGVGKGSTQVANGAWAANGPADATDTPDWWKATLPAMPAGTVLRYKIGVRRSAAATEVFPFSSDNIDLAERMETRFAITNFNAETAAYFDHNDYGRMSTGLDEGFHVLRSRAFVKRDDGASIFKTSTQVFYYDAARPSGVVRHPAENDTLGGSSYGAVVRFRRIGHRGLVLCRRPRSRQRQPRDRQRPEQLEARHAGRLQPRGRRRPPAPRMALRVRRHPGRRHRQSRRPPPRGLLLLRSVPLPTRRPAPPRWSGT